MFEKLKKGDTIGIISPAYIPVSERLYHGQNYLKEMGYKLKSGKNIEKKFGYFAGTDEQRLDDLHDMFRDDSVKAIMCARGGWGTLRYLDKIDYDLIKKNPKPVIGYSDLTSMQIAIYHKTAIGSLSGPMVAVEMGKGILNYTETHFWNYINNSENEYIISLAETGSEILCQGNANGTLLGGCLSLVSHLLGTPYCPDFSNSILFLEDVGEEPYKIDRYFAHLKQAGVFDCINGLILGDFVDCESENKENSFTLNDIILDYFSAMPYPVLTGFPYGHGDKKITMPVGASATIDLIKNNLVFSNLFAV